VGIWSGVMWGDVAGICSGVMSKMGSFFFLFRCMRACRDRDTAAYAIVYFTIHSHSTEPYRDGAKK